MLQSASSRAVHISLSIAFKTCQWKLILGETWDQNEGDSYLLVDYRGLAQRMQSRRDFTT